MFVPTRKHARLTAMDFLAFASADGKPTRFLQVDTSLLLMQSHTTRSDPSRIVSSTLLLYDQEDSGCCRL